MPTERTILGIKVVFVLGQVETGQSGFNMYDMTKEETEILEFYREGCSIASLCEVYGYSPYLMKKFLANEPPLQSLGYQWRRLFPLKIAT